MKTAIFVDGAYFLKRLRYLYKNKKGFDINNAENVVNELEKICYKHLNEKRRGENNRDIFEREHDLYRIFFYDCPPLAKKVHLPISKKCLDFSSTTEAKFRQEVHDLLKKKRKTALRLGSLQEFGEWQLKKETLKNLLNNTKQIQDLTDEDFSYQVKQKSVDMKIGVDITSVAYKKQVERMILIAGDADFVPAAKLARREGIDFILDPMWRNPRPDLFEHIDGLISMAYRSKKE